MANTIFGRYNRMMADNLAGMASQFRGMLRGDQNAAFQYMMRTNPKFAEFMKDKQGKTPQQFAQERGIDLEQVSKILGI